MQPRASARFRPRFLAAAGLRAGVVKSGIRKRCRALARYGARRLDRVGCDPTEGGLREIALIFAELGRASCPYPCSGGGSQPRPAPQAHHPQPPACCSMICGRERPGSGCLRRFRWRSAAGRAELEDAVQLRTQWPHRICRSRACATHFIVFTDARRAAIVTAAASGLTVRETPGLAVPALCELSFHDTRRHCSCGSRSDRDVAQRPRLACAARAVGAASGLRAGC